MFYISIRPTNKMFALHCNRLPDNGDDDRVWGQGPGDLDGEDSRLMLCRVCDFLFRSTCSKFASNIRSF